MPVLTVNDKIKLVVHVVLFLYSFVTFSQHTYLLQYEATFTTSSSQPTWHNTIYYVNNGVDKEIYDVTSIEKEASVNIFYIFTTNNPITSLKAKSVSVSGTLTSCTSIASLSPIQTFDRCSSNSSFIMKAVNGNRCNNAVITKFKLIEIEDFKAVNNFNTVNNDIKSCETKSLIMPTNCNYALEYNVPNNLDWEELLTYGNNASIVNISQDDFLGLQEGKNLQLRVRYSSLKGEIDINAYSSTLTYKLVGCSPQLQGPAVPQKTSCSYKNDGSFTLNFDRDLNSGEQLAITLFQKNTINGAFDIIPAGGQILDISTLSNKSYTWPNNLTAGQYKLKYQSHTGSLSGNDPSWTGNSLETVDLTIGNTAPVNFSITSSAIESCFDSNDGYIELQGSRESDRSLFYQYSTNGGISYTNWLPFLNTNTTRISGLGKGNYRIKVRDSQNCMAKK